MTDTEAGWHGTAGSITEVGTPPTIGTEAGKVQAHSLTLSTYGDFSNSPPMDAYLPGDKTCEFFAHHCMLR